MTKPSLTIFLPDEAATLGLAAKLAHEVGDSAVIFLQGQLGAGKTTFSRGFIQALGYSGAVKSPTYTLVEPYGLEGFQVFHFDFYRVRDPQELEYIGVRDYFVPHAICLIEWPEYGGDYLPPPDLVCQIELHSSGRNITFIAESKRGEKMLKSL